MEAQQQHDQNSGASDEEMEDQSDEQAGRSYECVYCKRGFTTAQALGGHMNIHRKDRARTHATTKTSTTGPFPLPPPLPKQVPKLHPPLFLNCPPPPPPPPSATQVNYPTYFPQSTSMAAAAYKNRSQFEEDWCSLRMSLEVGGTSHTGDGGGGGDQGESKKDDELDLELRLGYDP